jgi:hypothetical protein
MNEFVGTVKKLLEDASNYSDLLAIGISEIRGLH